ncbi:helix-turn-helix domain-containing protein [Saccharothrix sp. HUAS TT1]|uniref:helix-turn-helix domain-containing protein n=1 Tax=unclassified Saccharothrix TaxID=2593673 RepID=UPI00345BA39A
MKTEDLCAIWDDLVRAPVRVRVDGAGSRRGGTRTGALGAAAVRTVRAGPHAVVARPATGAGHVHFCLVLTGSATLAQDGREATACAGDLICFDSSRAFTLTMTERFSLVAVRVPHASLRARAVDTKSVTAQPWGCEPGLAAVVRHTLSGFGDCLEDLHEDITDLIGASFVNLLGMLLAQWLENRADESACGRGDLLAQVMRHGEARLGDFELTPHDLAQANHVSVRHLQQLFADKGTSPARWIREKRLEQCYADLCDLAKRHLSVAAIGARWGLPNASHFSRQFRLRYGVTPRELRNMLQAGVA